MFRSLLTPLLASIILASTTDALSWNIVPTDPTHVLLGDNVSLAWDYELDPGEDTNGFFQVIWARHEPHGWVNLAVKSSLSGISILRDEGHVLVDADAEATFIIMNVRESDHARYRCSIESKMSLSPASVKLNVLVPATVVWISENESFIEGASVTLSCWVKGNPVPYVTWYSPNGTLLHNATNSNNNSYTITGLRLDHVGAYRCFTKNVHGTDDKITYIYLPPSITTITPTLQTVNESDITSIYCNASGLPAPSISWSKMSSGVTIATGEHLVINNINRSESGDYLCTASNGVLGSALANATINVQYSPFIEVISRIPPITENQTLELYCNATGNPAPAIRWSKGSDVTVLSSGNSLTIRRVQGVDQGVYVCTASNGIGLDASSTTTVEVLVSPVIDVIQPRSQTVIEGQPASMYCNATGNPLPNIIWTRGNGSLVTSGMTLQITAAHRRETGTFRCTADNGVIRTAQAKVTLDVQYPPMIHIGPKDQTLNESNPLSLYCNATGNPSPNITWVKTGSQNVTVGHGHTLSINKTMTSDEGVYACVAENGVGLPSNATAMVTIIVFTAPVFDVIQPNITTNETDTIVLHCNATGNPPPRISWSISEQSGQRQLTGEKVIIQNILRSNTGIYRCTASNGVGNDVISQAHINVQYSPSISPLPSPYITLNRSQSLNLTCHTSGNPTPLVTWFKGSNNTPISSTWHGSLVIPDAGEETSGPYFCKAQNSLGSDTAHIHVIVEHPPVRTVLLTNATSNTLLHESTVLFNCSADAVPPPTIYRFHHDGIAVAVSSDGIFLIEHAQLKDSGMYTCVPENRLGEGESVTVNMTYQDGPEMSVSKYTISSWIGKPTSLTCSALGVPAPQITWSRPGQVSTSVSGNQATSELSLTPRSSRDFGEYVCAASNSAGSADARIALIELVPPSSPSISRVEPSDNEIKLNWEAPASDGGSPVVSYVASVQRTGKSTWKSCSTTDRSCVISDVKIASEYWVRAHAQNAVGAGQGTEVNVTVSDHEIRLIEEVWSSLLNDQQSASYTKLAEKFVTQVWSEYSQDSFLRGVGVKGFRSGSVITSFRLTRNDSQIDMTSSLNAKLTDGYLGNLKAQVAMATPSNTGAREGSDSATVGSVVTVFFLLLIVLIVLGLLYRRSRNRNVTLVESKEEAEDQNESYKTQHENATGQAWTTEKRLENSPQNEDEGIEMDMYSDRDSRVSRLSPRTEHAPSSRPHTPLHKNRVHPAQGPAHGEGACTTNSDQFIPTEYAAVLEKSGTKDRLYAELAWLETKGRPKRRQRLPSISGSAVPQRKYSILEILKDQQRPRANRIGSEARPRTSSVGNESTVEYTNESI
ncbi:hemicentin-2 isoform X2 [Nematostella vectensis]|uniref:hemicentin-2 isoform X2 n=1 Tax=Nematostella vectensis TaxID=45351 RepID=UPI0020773C4D|nr:hemicentin-2 isoform X2 [Nematostella vectensis]